MIRTASAIAAVCPAGVASADPIPLPALAPPEAQSPDLSRSAAALPADLPSLLGPVRGGFQLPTLPLLQAEETTLSIAPAQVGSFGVFSGVWDGQTMLGDIGGLRPALAEYGVTLMLTENAETFGNLTGGVKQGFEATGLTTASLQVDTEKAFGLKGGLFAASGLQIWGGNLTADNLLNLQIVTGIEAPVAIRLWELWYDQKFSDKFDIKIGEQSLDQEFMISQSSTVFINAVLGWPALPAVDLPGGGPAYPLASLGVRGRAQATDNIGVLAGLFSGSPIPRNSPNTPASNPNGVSFPLDTDVLAIAELQFGLPGASDSKATDGGSRLGTYKIGAWYDSYGFSDQQYDTIGLPLASPNSNGIPAPHHGNFSIYGVMDQTVWVSKDNRKLVFFFRPMFTPFQNRNLVSFTADAGLTLYAPLPNRDDDTFGVGVGVAKVSNGASGYDRDLQFYQPSVYTPVRSTETFVEATYQFQAAPWWQIQPDLQYIINPGAGVANPNDPNQKIKNEFVIGLRTNITF